MAKSLDRRGRPDWDGIDAKLDAIGIDSLDNYRITDLDTSGATQYFGYTDKDNNWYIMELTSTTARYIKGTTDYATNWTGRAGLSYEYFYNTF